MRDPKRTPLAIVCSILALALVNGRATAYPEVELEGALDLVLTSGDEQTVDGNIIGYGENPFHTTRVRLLANAPIRSGVAAFTEVNYDDGARLRLVGGFVRLSDPKGRDLHLEVGKIPFHIGAFPDRASAQRNNLVGFPLMYQYWTVVRNDQVPQRGEDLVANRGLGLGSDFIGAGLTGVGGYSGFSLPVIYEDYWDFGAVLIGTAAPVELSLGVTNGTAADPQANDNNGGKQVLGRLGCQPMAGVRLGVSGARGAYLYDDLAAVLPAGRSVTDYNQNIAAADLELSRGHGVLYGEYLWNRFESPFVGDLDLRSWYVEGKFTVLPGWFVAGRLDRMMFGDVALSTGAETSWDADVWRREFGLGFKPSKSLVAKLVHQESKIAVQPPLRRGFAAAQLSVVF